MNTGDTYVSSVCVNHLSVSNKIVDSITTIQELWQIRSVLTLQSTLIASEILDSSRTMHSPLNKTFLTMTFPLLLQFYITNDMHFGTRQWFIWIGTNQRHQPSVKSVSPKLASFGNETVRKRFTIDNRQCFNKPRCLLSASRMNATFRRQ